MDQQRTDNAYERLDVPVELSNHALYGSLLGPGLIERFDVYRRRRTTKSTTSPPNGKNHNEVVYFNVLIGHRLTGHDGIVHGGIISLLFDETCGWGYECIRGTAIPAVTASLIVNYRQPLKSGVQCMIKVFHKKTEGRKLTFFAKLESASGDTVYADATCIYMTLRSKL